MKIINKVGSYPETGKPTAVAMGYFDGVHIGHQAVIKLAAEMAAANNLELAVFTFSLNPAKNQKGRLLLAKHQKYELLAQMGVNYCFDPDFENFKSLPPEQFFTETLLKGYKAKAISCGEDFLFGANRAGTPQLLRKLCQENGVMLGVAPTALWQGEPVSSTRIRQALEQGDIPLANGMLGRPYEIDYPVRHGKKIGRTLGFPTLNQVFQPEMQPPGFGVYITSTAVGNNCWPSVTGYGPRPTVDADQTPTCETFIPGFSADLYGKDVRVRFYEKIGEITKFETPQLLAQAVQDWAAQSVAYFAEK